MFSSLFTTDFPFSAFYTTKAQDFSRQNAVQIFSAAEAFGKFFIVTEAKKGNSRKILK